MFVCVKKENTLYKVVLEIAFYYSVFTHTHTKKQSRVRKRSGHSKQSENTVTAWHCKKIKKKVWKSEREKEGFEDKKDTKNEKLKRKPALLLCSNSNNTAQKRQLEVQHKTWSQVFFFHPIFRSTLNPFKLHSKHPFLSLSLSFSCVLPQTNTTTPFWPVSFSAFSVRLDPALLFSEPLHPASMAIPWSWGPSRFIPECTQIHSLLFHNHSKLFAT